MAKAERASGFWTSMLAIDLYKRNQGRLTRQLTAAAILIAVGLACWSLHQTLLADVPSTARYATTSFLAAAGLWFAFRVVNYPLFADFLIDVEGEMAKVAWPSREELKRATIVVLVVMFLLSAVLFLYDLIWQQLLRAIGILQF